MKLRIAKKLKAKGQWDFVKDAPIKREVPQFAKKSTFLGEIAIRERYFILQQLDPKHPLLGVGTINNGNFQFNASVEYNDSVHGQINYSKSSVLCYVGALMRAIRDLGGECYPGEREFQARLEKIAQGDN